MRTQLLYLSVFIFCACSSSATEDASVKKDSVAVIQDTTTVAIDSVTREIDWNEPDPLKIAKMKEYAASWDNRYFPLPDEGILYRFSYVDPGYLYISHNFDSLGARTFTENYETRGEDEELNTNPCAWEQKFKTDIYYSSSTCSESSESVVIHTKCPDKKVLVRLVDILYHDTEYMWNADSTQYHPIEEEAGCYYHIKKNDAGGYDIEYLCGC